VQKRTITNLKAIANEEGKPFWYDYPRWIGARRRWCTRQPDGKGQLFLYKLADGSTTLVSTNAGADYRYPFGEGEPN